MGWSVIYVWQMILYFCSPNFFWKITQKLLFTATLNYFYSNNGYIDNIVNEVENMDDFCDLYKHVYHNFNPDDFNYINKPLPGQERSKSILYASNLLDME